LLLPSKINATSDPPFKLPVSFSIPNFHSTHHSVLPVASPISSLAPTSPRPSPSTTSHISPIASTSETALAPVVLPSHSMTTRLRTGSLRPKSFPDFHLYYTSRHPPKPTVLHAALSESEPPCFSKATTDSRWREAMAQEFDALISNGTWTLCPRPSQQHVIKNRWVYKIKQRPDGSIDRFKARLVAKGYEQQSGVDYSKTFSPVIKPSTICIILALAVNFNLLSSWMCQMRFYMEHYWSRCLWNNLKVFVILHF
jgi:hypothetical protein